MTSRSQAARERLLAKIYQHVPTAEREAFRRFRAENPPRTGEIGSFSAQVAKPDVDIPSSA